MAEDSAQKEKAPDLAVTSPLPSENVPKSWPSEGDMVAEHFQLESVIGAGAKSIVYRARHNLTSRPVAFKLFAPVIPVPEWRESFEKEAKLISSLDHPNIINLNMFGLDSDSRPYLVSDLVEGQSLEQLLSSEGKLAVKEALAIALQITSALDYAHSKDIVHKYLRPSNIMVSSPDPQMPTDTREVKVGDFELNLLVDSDDAALEPDFLSPEQCEGKPTDRRSDLYALACIIMKMVSGNAPFVGTNEMAVVAQHLKEDPPHLSKMPSLETERSSRTDQQQAVLVALDGVLIKALNKDPDQRYQTAKAFARALQDALQARSSHAHEGPVFISHLKNNNLFFNYRIVIGGLFLCVLLYISTLIYYSQWNTPTETSESAKEISNEPAKEETEKPVKMPPISVFPPDSFKSSPLMFDPLYVFDGIHNMRANTTNVEDWTKILKTRQERGFGEPGELLQLASDSVALGRTLVDSGNPRPAIDEFSRAISLQDLSPKDKEAATNFSLDDSLLQSAYVGLGDTRLAMGNYKEAIDAYNKAQKFYTTGDVFYDKLKDALLLKRIALCTEALGASARIPGKDNLALASAVLHTKDPQDTIDRKIIAGGALADIYFHKKDYKEAFQQYDDTLKIANDLPSEYNSVNEETLTILKCKRAFCLGLMGKTNESNSLFGQALNESNLKDYCQPRIALALAVVLNKAGLKKNALEQVKSALELCTGTDKDILSLKLSLIKYALSEDKSAMQKDEISALESQQKSLDGQNLTRDLRPATNITQYNAESVFGE